MFSMKQTFGAEMNKDRDYMTVPEQQLFKELVRIGQITVFGIARCKNEGCEGEVPRSKKYCSKSCMEVDNDETREVD